MTASTASETQSPMARRARWIKAIIAIALLVYAATDMHRFLRVMETRKPTLKRWLPYAAELGQDSRLYDRHPDYLYPPFFLVMIRPLTHVPPAVAAVIWQLTKYAVVLALFTAIWQLATRAASAPSAPPTIPNPASSKNRRFPVSTFRRFDVSPFPPWAMLLTIVLSVRFVVSDLRHGNINLFIAIAVVGALWCLSRRLPFVAGLLVAAAACTKVTPALFAVYLLYKRRWIALVGVIVGTILCLELVPLLVISPSLNHALLGSWFQHVVGNFLSGGDVESLGMNQSLVAVTNRIFGNASAVPPEDLLGWFHLSDPAIRWIQRILSLTLLALLAWSCRGPAPQSGSLTELLEWSLVAPVTLALSGYTWTGHFCLLIPAIAAILVFIAPPRPRAPSLPVLIPTILAFAIFLFTSDILTSAVREWTSRVGLQLLGALLLFAALFLARRSLRSPSPS